MTFILFQNYYDYEYILILSHVQYYAKYNTYEMNWFIGNKNPKMK